MSADSDTRLTAELSATPDFAKTGRGGSVTASGARDHIAKLTVSGPAARTAGTSIASSRPMARTSPIGRTRTLPMGETARFNIGVFSCSNLPFGWFNAYAHAAARNDIDLAVHLGDYLYEYGLDVYPTRSQALAGRSVQPDHEMVTLADYRLRYASYRLDPDLQRLHQVVPMIAMWDDHEIANDAWRDGAQNHQSATEGDYATRRRIAEQVYREWMPVADLTPADALWSSYQIGNLATIIRTESRLSGRDKPVELAEALRQRRGSGSGARQVPRRKLGRSCPPDAGRRSGALAGRAVQGIQGIGHALAGLGAAMRDGLAQAAARNRTTGCPRMRRRSCAAALLPGLAASKAGLPFNMDAWDGYPVQREALLKSAQTAGCRPCRAVGRQPQRLGLRS